MKRGGGLFSHPTRTRRESKELVAFPANETETTKETAERNNEGLYTLITKVVAAFCHNNSRKRGRGVRGYPARATV